MRAKPSKIVALCVAICAAAPLWAAESALDWIETQLERNGNWQRAEAVELPSGKLFIGDPSWSDDYHLRGAVQLDLPRLEVLVFFETGRKDASFIWLEASGERPTSQQSLIGFGTDGGTLAIGDYDSGLALANMDAQARDEWYFDGIIGRQNWIKTDWYSLTDGAHNIFIVGVGSDGGKQATAFYDQHGNLSGIAIDLAGRKSDGQWIDLLLPEK